MSFENIVQTKQNAKEHYTFELKFYSYYFFSDTMNFKLPHAISISQKMTAADSLLREYFYKNETRCV